MSDTSKAATDDGYVVMAPLPGPPSRPPPSPSAVMAFAS